MIDVLISKKKENEETISNMLETLYQWGNEAEKRRKRKFYKKKNFNKQRGEKYRRKYYNKPSPKKCRFFRKAT